MRVLQIGTAFMLSAALCVVAQAQQERESRELQQRPERTGAETATNPETERLWEQIAMLHNRIVEIEVAQHQPGRGTASSATERQRPGQGEVGQESRTTARQAPQEKELWTQLSRVHQQLVAAQLSESGSASPGQSGVRTESSDQERRSATDRNATDDNENAERQDTSRLGQASGTSRGMQEQLWQQFTAIQKQLLEHAVKQAKMSPQQRRANLPSTPGEERPEFDGGSEERDQ